MMDLQPTQLQPAIQPNSNLFSQGLIGIDPYQVSRAARAAVAGPKPGNRDPDSRHISQRLAPGTFQGGLRLYFPTLNLGLIANRSNAGYRTQRVDMPVRLSIAAQMPTQPGPQTTGPVGTPQVEIVANREGELSQAAYPQDLGCGQVQPEQVGAGCCRYFGNHASIV